MFGIKIAPGAMADASLGDKLGALGAAFGGDMQAVQAIRQRLEREKLASEIARRLASGDGSGLDAGRQLAPEPAPQPEPSVAPGPAAAANVITNLQGGSLGDLPLMKPRAAISAPSPDLSALPMRGQGGASPARGLYEEVLPMLIAAAGKGIDASGMGSLVRTEDYVRGLPTKDRAAARLDPDKFADRAHTEGLPLITEASPGSVITRSDRRTGKTSAEFAVPGRPEPVTTERVVGAIVQKKAAGMALSADETDIYNRWKAGQDGFYGERAPRQRTTSVIVGEVMEKVRRGEALSAGEQEIWENHKKGVNVFDLLRGGGGDEEEEAPARAPPGASPALPRKPAAPNAGAGAASAQPPPQALAVIKEGQTVTYANGQVWTRRDGKPARVK